MEGIGETREDILARGGGEGTRDSVHKGRGKACEGEQERVPERERGRERKGIQGRMNGIFYFIIIIN